MFPSISESLLRSLIRRTGALEGAAFAVNRSPEKLIATPMRNIGSDELRARALHCLKEIVSLYINREKTLLIPIRGAVFEDVQQYCALVPCQSSGLTFSAITMIYWLKEAEKNKCMELIRSTLSKLLQQDC